MGHGLTNMQNLPQRSKTVTKNRQNSQFWLRCETFGFLRDVLLLLMLYNWNHSESYHDIHSCKRKQKSILFGRCYTQIWADLEWIFGRHWKNKKIKIPSNVTLRLIRSLIYYKGEYDLYLKLTCHLPEVSCLRIWGWVLAMKLKLSRTFLLSCAMVAVCW